MTNEIYDSSWHNWQYTIPETIRSSLQEYLARQRRFVDEGISEFLRNHYKGHTLDIVSHVADGGKRLRGVLAILICEALGGDAATALPASVAVELAHAASLAHDDVIDNDVTRRGRQALHVRYDVATAILIPHLIVPHSILSVQIYGPKAISVIVEGWARVAEGQARDYLSPTLSNNVDSENYCTVPSDDWADSPQSIEQEYWSIIRDKTAALFEIAAALGAIAAHDDLNAALAKTYAGHLGMAFQIADDVTDLHSYAYQPLSAIRRLGALGTSRSMRAVCQMIAVSGDGMITPDGIGWARQLVSRDVQRSVECARMFPDSPMRDLLCAFPAFAVDEIYAEAQSNSRQNNDLENMSYQEGNSAARILSSRTRHLAGLRKSLARTLHHLASKLRRTWRSPAA